MYRLTKDILTNEPLPYVMCIDSDSTIPFAPGNTGYANFKAQINAGTAQLEDADGNLMTPEQAKDFVKELP